MLSIRHWLNYCCREWYAFNLSVRPGQGERGEAGGGAGEATTTSDGGHLQYIPSHDAHSTLGLSFPLLLLLEPQLPPVFPPFPPSCTPPGSCISSWWGPSLCGGFAGVHLGELGWNAAAQGCGGVRLHPLSPCSLGSSS